MAYVLSTNKLVEQGSGEVINGWSVLLFMKIISIIHISKLGSFIKYQTQ